MYEVELTATAQKDLLFWKRNDQKTLKRIRALIANILETPYTGLGKPEPLRFEWSGCYSRRIDSQNRLVYSVDDDQHVITIYLMRYHY
jgi:toxin YoeB